MKCSGKHDTTWNIPRSIKFFPLHFMLYRGMSISFGTVWVKRFFIFGGRGTAQNFDFVVWLQALRERSLWFCDVGHRLFVLKPIRVGCPTKFCHKTKMNIAIEKTFSAVNDNKRNQANSDENVWNHKLIKCLKIFVLKRKFSIHSKILLQAKIILNISICFTV